MSDNHLAVYDSLRRQLAAVNCIAPIVDSIRKIRVEGLTDKKNAGLFRHAADELNETTMTKDGEVDPPIKQPSATAPAAWRYSPQCIITLGGWTDAGETCEPW